MSRRPPTSDTALVELFLDMQAAERGAGKNTLDAYRNDLADLAAHLRAAGRGVANAPAPTTCADFLASLAERGFTASSLARRLSALRQLYRFLYAEGKRGDDPAAVLEGPKRARTLPKILSIAEVDTLLARAREQRRECGAAAGRAPACGAAALPVGSGLRHRPARLRAGGAAGHRRAARSENAGGARQGRQGTAGAAQPGGQARHGRVPQAARRRPARRMRNRNGCFPRSASRAISAASISPATSKPSGRPPASRRRASPRMCCGMPSPVICCITAPICAWCRLCSAMPTSRPRRSTPMCWKNA